jgi:Mother cell inhibitor of FtsZ
MNIYVHEKGIILTGKAWEVVQKLKEYTNHFHFVSDWVESLPVNTSEEYQKQSLVSPKKTYL